MVDVMQTQPRCPDCGLIHPPVSVGQKCPLAKEKTSSGDLIDTSQFLSQLRNVVVSKIQIKKIKDPKKVFSAVIIEVTKFLEQYKDE